MQRNKSYNFKVELCFLEAEIPFLLLTFLVMDVSTWYLSVLVLHQKQDFLIIASI